jgi:hypothetical protein
MKLSLYKRNLKADEKKLLALEKSITGIKALKPHLQERAQKASFFSFLDFPDDDEF